MKQRFKPVYFADHPAESSQQKHLTLAFGARDAEIFEDVKLLSSLELRELIGHQSFTSLQEAANQEGLAINTYCMRSLRLRERSLAYDVADKVQPSLIQTTLPMQTEESFIDPLQATFRGGASEPLHAWYPYLEGYSPEFVRRLVKEFAPKATTILDPFSGTGTTPLAVAMMGKQAFYCELNPLMQYVMEVKLLALMMKQRQRASIAAALSQLAQHLEAFVDAASPDEILRDSYTKTFGISVFFDEDVFDKVLRIRSAIDDLACTQPDVAKFLTVAVLAQLIPASRLIRRGDVRFRTDAELRRNRVDFLGAVSANLRIIGTDIEKLQPVNVRPMLVCEDARQLAHLPERQVDAVITSPPYLNGTNYFRNTKVELWFLRCLNSNGELATYRYKAVTAGINDVTVGKPHAPVGRQVEALVERLCVGAYDARIPRMVASYFFDMWTVFAAMKPHLADGAPVLVDIGDSHYGKVHVPTNSLLASILKGEGFELDREITLRTRSSRNGTPLRQVLLSFRFHRQRSTAATSLYPQNSSVWESHWENFKLHLPHQRGEFARRNWGHPLHSLCSYQGKMKPSLAYHLVKAFVPTGGRILDPFGGVGTIPFEAALQGKHAWTFEIGLAPLHVTAAKLGRSDKQQCDAILYVLDNYIQTNRVTEQDLASAQSISFNGPLPSYFNSETLREILLARRFFLEHLPQNPSESLVLASLLHILHGNRPYALSRRSHPITPFAPTGPDEYRALMPRLRTKVARSLEVAVPDSFVPGKVFFQDATSWWPQEIDHLDAVITSPPFFDSTRFYLANWMRLWFCGWSAEDFRTKPLTFVDERQKTGFEIYEPIFRQSRERLKSGGVMVLHLGKSKKCDMAEALSRIARPWFHIADIFTESVEHCETHGIRDKGTVTEHTYLVLR